MNRIVLVTALLLAAPAACAADMPAPDTNLQKLAISEGVWVYHGDMIEKPGAKPTPFVWHADCRWAANHAFMQCSYSNTWGEKHINSLVVDTYNHDDHSFWHYEIFEDGKAPEKPFASKMAIKGKYRTESWTETKNGKTIYMRIRYRFDSDKTDAVSIEHSPDNFVWTVDASANGEKIAP